jgi:hypothetical protein
VTNIQDQIIAVPACWYPKLKFAKMPVRTEISENDTAKLEKPFIDLLNSSLYPNLLL